MLSFFSVKLAHIVNSRKFFKMIFSRHTFGTQKKTTYPHRRFNSFKFALLATLFITIIIVATNTKTVYGWSVYPSTDEYREAVNEAMKGEINAEASGTFFPLIQIATFNCALTSNVEGGVNTSKYCPELLISQMGVIPALAKATQGFYEIPPANLAFWIRDTGQSLGLIPQTIYAQAGRGIGFSGMVPLLAVWKAFRNIAYILVSFAIIIVGFMIMFRKKIDPHTIVTIQEALPRIIIVLILITFSYAIAGFLIDLMYLALIVVYGIFNTSNLLNGVTQTGRSIGILGMPVIQMRDFLDVLLSGNMVEAFYLVFPAGANDLFTIASWFFTGGGNDLWAYISGSVGGLLGGFLLNILIMILFIRLFFLFLNTYVQIVLQVIFSPFYILMDIFPGNNNTSTWIKNIIANLSVFVISGTIFMLTVVFNNQIAPADGGKGSSVWVPPYVAFGSTAESISALFSIGILLMLPTIVKTFKESIKSSGGLNPASGIGSGITKATNFAYSAALLGANFIRTGRGGGHTGKTGGE